MTYICEYRRKGVYESEEIEADTMQQAAEIIKKKYDNITYLSVGYPEEEQERR